MIENVEKLRVQPQFYTLPHSKPLREIEIAPEKIRTAQVVAAESSELAILRSIATVAGSVLGSTVDTKALGLSH